MATSAGLGTAMREEVWAIVRAAVEEAMGPLVARQRELEARVERAERSQSASAKLASIPVAFAPSLAPVAPVMVAAPASPLFDAAPGSVTDPGMTTIPDLKAPSSSQHATAVRRAANPSAVSGTSSTSTHPAPRGSVAPQGYGVTVMTASRPTLDLENVGTVDISGFDGGRRKRQVAGTVVVMMLLIIAAVVTMTVLSHN